jgi:hypothetical protein
MTADLLWNITVQGAAMNRKKKMFHGNLNKIGVKLSAYNRSSNFLDLL